MRRVGASGRCNGPSSPVAARHHRQNFRAGKSLTLAGDLVGTCIRGGAARMHRVPRRSATNSNVPNLAAPASRRATANWPPPARPQQEQRPRVGHRAVHGPCWRGTPTAFHPPNSNCGRPLQSALAHLTLNLQEKGKCHTTEPPFTCPRRGFSTVYVLLAVMPSPSGARFLLSQGLDENQAPGRNANATGVVWMKRRELAVF